MNTVDRHHKIQKHYLFYVVFVVLYTTLTFSLPANPVTLRKYHLTVTSLHMLDLTIVIPLVLIWFAAFYGYSQLKQYATLIKKNKDGRQVARLAKGLGWLAFSLPISSIVSAVLNYLARNNLNFLPSATIIENYVSLAIPLGGYYFISRGARGLTDLVKQRPTQRGTYIFAAVLITIGAGFCHAIFNNTWILSTNNAHKTPVYYLPNWLIFLTIVLPYIFMWFIGLLAAYELHIYTKNVSGILYRKGLHLVSFGLGGIIILSVLLEFITTLSGHINHLTVNGLLLLVYLILASLSAVYVIVAFGAKRLRKIEEV